MPQQEFEPIKILSNPTEFLNLFRRSNHFKQAFDEFKIGKAFTEESPGEMQAKFEEMESARQAMVKFAITEGVVLHYEPSMYDKNNPLDEYFTFLRDHISHPEKYADVVAYDKLRAMYHDDATKYLSKKLNLSFALAVGMTQIMAVDKKLQSFGFVEQNRLKMLAKSL